MVHHSRDTAVKQWSESRCTVVEGVVRLVRVFYDLLNQLVGNFQEALKRIMEHGPIIICWTAFITYISYTYIGRSTNYKSIIQKVSMAGVRAVHAVFIDLIEYPEILC